ncbi:MAG TPA: hypothetical protein VFV99_09520 [Kofleriaceae bacterium]|nr:hypothetical protein [Kofleriaceae bacterium]
MPDAILQVRERNMYSCGISADLLEPALDDLRRATFDRVGKWISLTLLKFLVDVHHAS